MNAWLAVGLLAGMLLAGCSGGSGPSPTTGPGAFDGAAALAFVKEFATHADGTPRYRIPSSVGQAEGAAVLWSQTDLPGWSRTWQNLTGADYLKLNRSVVQGYTPGPDVIRPYCSEADEQALPALRFANLLVVHHAAAGAPMLLLGAHWDSQMHSDNDIAANRSRPDPGANDGASGVGVLVQLMRQLPPDLPISVGLLFVDGEDGFYDCYPDAGSLSFAQTPHEPVAAFVLLDMVGDPGALYPRETFSRQSAPHLLDLVWSHGQSTPYGAAHFVNASKSIFDDQLAFTDAGIPAIDIVDAARPDTGFGFPPQWDTSFDTVDRLDARMLGLVGDTLLATLKDPALKPLLVQSS